MARFSLEVGFSTDVGRQRRRNEDSYAVFVPYPGEGNPSQLAGLMLVADGMGGERAGDRASQLAAKRLRHWFSTGIYCSWPQFAGDQPLKSALIHAIRTVSHEIFQLGEKDPMIRGLGSTVVMAAMTGRQMVLAHVGDSRLYLVRDGKIQLLTSDHSWVQRQVDAGVLSQEDARTHPQRNILTRSLGDAVPPEVDASRVELRDRDLFILCSDGLTGGVTDSELQCLAQEIPEPQPLAEALVRMANDKDGSDNITAVVGVCHEDNPDKRREFENQSTRQIVIEDGVVEEVYDGDTEVDIPRPTLADLADSDDDPEDVADLETEDPAAGNLEDTATLIQNVASHANEADDGSTPSHRATRLRDTQEFPQLFEGIEAPTWRAWLAAALVALALGLLAGYLVQHSNGLEAHSRNAATQEASDMAALTGGI